MERLIQRRFTAPMNSETTLVVGGTGTTGRRIVARLQALDLPVRVGSRQGSPRFDWDDAETWGPALEGAGAVYIAYHPDIAIPGTAKLIGSFAEAAVDAGAERLVLLSGRGEEEAARCERAVRESGAAWTTLACSWFMQNFSEGFLSEPVIGGLVALPTTDVVEPFVDVDDVAAVAVAALTEDGHAGVAYELSGPSALTFDEAIGTIAAAAGRSIGYARIDLETFGAGLRAEGLPPETADQISYLFSDVLDGRNAEPRDGVEQALGRPPRSFGDWARDTAAAGAWAVGGVSSLH